MSRLPLDEPLRVLGVSVPSCAALKSRPCSPEEMQAVLVGLLEHVEQLQLEVLRLKHQVGLKQDKPWRASL